MYNSFFVYASLFLSMRTNLFSSVYLLLLFLFLFPLVIFISFQLFTVLSNYVIFNLILSMKEKQYKDVLFLIDIYIIRKQWLDCILFLESEIKKDCENIDYYNALGFCYFSLELYSYSKSYYSQALILEPSSIQVLTQLGQIYYRLQDFQQSLDMYNRVLVFDQYNKNAIKYINILNKQSG